MTVKDLKTFADDDFDPKKWINRAWSSSGNQEKEIVTSVPRILQDASTLQVEGALLQQKLLTLEDQVQGVERQTGQSIESLQRIDRLKSRLETAASALREADKWAALASALEDILETGVPTSGDKLAQLAEQVAAMTASLEVLTEAPDYEYKRVQLETLYNRLEAAVSSPFIDALTQMDAVLKSETPLAEIVRLYTDLLPSLDPSPTKVVLANFKLCQSPEEGMALLEDLKTDIEEFVSCIRAIVDAPRPNKETLPANTLKELGRAVYQNLFKSKFISLILYVKNRDNDMCHKALSSSILSLISSHSRRIETHFLSCVTSGQSAGVLSESFPAALALEAATAELLRVLAAGLETGEDPDHPLLDLRSLLLDGEVSPPQLTSVSGLQRAREQLRSLARAVLRNPVDVQLDKIPQLSVWHNNDALSTDLPDFALSPQEYITEIGQYLMTLPQHLEMHLPEKQAPWQFLSEVCSHTCEVYAEKILNVRNMDALGTKRCLTDIVYLSSVVEDLGTSITPALKNLEKSLRAAAPSQNE
ncbi:Conserved oligomeric Golgi complex subunit 7 [Papilio machaon]|uniref:Conserved oligomeric Golgi complex subunit 7 n=1 Tax=Papilio machaon TaxID=76193 RepID=A0A0N0PCY5_PAPMA|nr:Conserved oligomeric Golgi complex subunit 7 [Papilio machaon]